MEKALDRTAPSAEVRQTVILAAGHGQRIGSQDHGTPKPLVEVAGRPLIEYALAQARGAGCEEAIVVVGNGGRKLEEYIRSADLPLAVDVVVNPEYHLPNGISLLAAEKHVKGAFFLQMADHLFAEPVLAHLRKGMEGHRPQLLLVDRQPVYSDEEDATKVRLNGRSITAIGKDLTAWDAVDTGCFLLDGRVFDSLRSVGDPGETSVTAGMQRLIEAGMLEAEFIEEIPWVDVDTVVDREAAERLFGRGGPYRG